MLAGLKSKWFRKRIVAYAYDAKERNQGKTVIKRYLIVKELVNKGAKIIKIGKIKCVDDYNLRFHLRWLDRDGYMPLSHYIYCTNVFNQGVIEN